MMCGVHERAPHPLLRGAVLRYAGYEERAAAPVRRTELPQDRVSLILNLGGPFEVEGRRFGSFVAPVDDRPALTGFEGSARGVQVDLTPFAARALLGVPLDALRRRPRRRPRRRARPRGRGARGAARRRARVGGALRPARRPARPRLAGAPAPPPDAARAWARLQATAGGVRIGALAGELGCSRRHLAARFREHVGVPPKTVARILRFRRALTLLRGGAGLAATAQDCGFADQPHLNREFRALAGATPVTFVQDGTAAAA